MYRGRLADAHAELKRVEALHAWAAKARAAAGLIALAGLILARLIGGWWLVLPGLGLISLALAEKRLLARRWRAQRRTAFYERGQARLEGRRTGSGNQGNRFASRSHPYAVDLDVFGAGGLFELLPPARTRTGEEVLAGWLLAPSPVEEVRARQQAVEELRPRLDMREHLALLGEDAVARLDAEPLPRWGECQPLADSRAARRAAAVLAAIMAPFIFWLNGVFLILMSMTLFGSGGVEPPDLIAPLRCVLALGAVNATFALYWRRRVRRSIASVREPARDLDLLGGVLARLERETFASPLLAGIRSTLDVEGLAASRRIARLQRLMELLDSRGSAAIGGIGPALLWSTQVAFAVEAWRKANGALVRRWLRAVAEFDALNTLAGYASEHPDDPFPEFAEGTPLFHAEALGHPLLPPANSVPNDVRLDAGLRLLVVSGSNMSGKSTLLRAVGLNAVLAMAGAPVRARQLRLSPLAVGACISVVDSLQGGVSRFYAAITRIRQIAELARSAPSLFLLDELLEGTNSYDRNIGAETIARHFVERGAIGLITAHDLALARIADALAPRAANVHFEDQLEDGVMRFDYRLRPGVVRHSNALELMRRAGVL